MGSTTSPPRFESAPADPAPLGQPLEYPFSKRSAPNRFLKGAMSERLASFSATDLSARGVPSPEAIRLYERWGQGGWGQLLTGNIMIDPGHLEAPGNYIIPRDSPYSGERFDAFKALAEGAKKEGSLIVGQVSHPGRQTSDDVQSEPISASAVQLVSPAMKKTYAVPRAATKEDIAAIIDGFAHAAEYLEKAGFDGIELHGAHGYLLAQFLSPTTNQRTDNYGGSLENRARLILEVAAEVKKRVTDKFVLGIKVNSVEFQDKGFTPEDAVELCQLLEGAGFDYVETSGGTYESQGFEHKKDSTRARESFFIEFAERIAKSLSKTKVYTTGGFKTVAGMVGVLGAVDGVGIGRAATQEPDLPKTILEGKATGIMKYAIGEDEFFMRLFASSMQMKAMGHGEEPLDLTVPDNVQKVGAAIAMMMKQNL
ncbi:NADH oxidase [Pseudomassariella vexata]|uniref:NADH oxidase n=1 Tax=Pseudomassariella vexata TaxID=1141098 RepID=A0A1Y2ECG5_9PEZI|nr:NADH oxidase [Pseudomassariella vexata]ORY69097.1 NADH oxidase [Pseudomassariella vexata]